MRTKELQKMFLTIRDRLREVFAVVGILWAIASISSLLQAGLGVSLATLPAEILTDYRTAAAGLKYLMFDFWLNELIPGMILPAWLFDIFTLWILSGSLSARAWLAVRAYNASRSRSMSIKGGWRDVLLGPIALRRTIKEAWNMYRSGREQRRKRRLRARSKSSTPHSRRGSVSENKSGPTKIRVYKSLSDIPTDQPNLSGLRFILYIAREDNFLAAKIVALSLLITLLGVVLFFVVNAILI